MEFIILGIVATRIYDLYWQVEEQKKVIKKVLNYDQILDKYRVIESDEGNYLLIKDDKS